MAAQVEQVDYNAIRLNELYQYIKTISAKRTEAEDRVAELLLENSILQMDLDTARMQRDKSQLMLGQQIQKLHSGE